MSGVLLDWNAKPSSTAPPPASFYQDRRMVSFLHCLPYCCGWCCIPAFKISQPVVQQVCLFLSHVGNLRYTLRECVYTSPTVTNVCITSPNSKFTSQNEIEALSKWALFHSSSLFSSCQEAGSEMALHSGGTLCTLVQAPFNNTAGLHKTAEWQTWAPLLDGIKVSVIACFEISSDHTALHNYTSQQWWQAFCYQRDTPSSKHHSARRQAAVPGGLGFGPELCSTADWMPLQDGKWSSTVSELPPNTTQSCIHYSSQC